MAVGEARQQVTAAKGGNVISQVSWVDGVAQDNYYGLQHSFQYASNINTDDELHGIKLSNRAVWINHYAHCQLTSLGDNGVIALDLGDEHGDKNPPIFFNEDTFLTNGVNPYEGTTDMNPYILGDKFRVAPGVVFQDYFRYSVEGGNDNEVAMAAIRVGDPSDTYISQPVDHLESTDEDIGTPAATPGKPMMGAVTAILNYNNTRLVVATSGSEPAIWVYYPELDQNSPVLHPYDPGSADNGTTGWKKVLTYEAGVTIVGLTCSFEYLKVRAVDEGWNTKVYYYQGNNNLRDTFVYNLVDLNGVRVCRVYSINGIDYYVSSLDGSDNYVNLYKLVGTTPIQLFKQRTGLDTLDVNYKAPYFVGPTSITAAYNGGKFYIGDAYGVFQFSYDPQGYDKGYMKWRLMKPDQEGGHVSRPVQIYGVCINKHYLYVSTEEGCYMMDILDTGKPPFDYSILPDIIPDSLKLRLSQGYQPQGVLISREYEGKEGGTVTKMLDEIRLNYELNQMTRYNGSVDIYVSPNNTWKSTTQFNADNNWHHVMSISQTNAGTRTEKSNLFNDLNNGESAFKFDWQTITYAIVITRFNTDVFPNEEEDTPEEYRENVAKVVAMKATPIVREIDIKYHCKDKINKVYDIN